MFRNANSNIIFLLLITLFTACGGIKSNLRKADSSFQKGEYAVAGDLYRKAYSRISYKDKSLRAETAFKQGECYRLINYSRAEQVYLNAVRNKYPDSIAYLRLAQMQHKNGKYRDAATNYSIYLESHPYNELALNGLKSVKLIDSLRNNPTRYIVSRDKNLNAVRSSSFSPSFTTADADVLVFTSNRKINKKDNSQKKNSVSGQPNNHLFSIKKNNQGRWEKAEILEGEVTTKNDEGIASFPADGNSMYFTRSLTEASKGEGALIVLSNRSGGSWGAPQSISFFNDSSISVAHPAIAPDGKMLYFVSDAPGGYGGKDIWRAELENGKPAFVENLGPEINTSGDEMFPTFKKDGTLYYSSNGKPGFGGLDIFKAELKHKADSTEGWKVTNMGYPLNSSADDFGMTFSGDSESGYFSSNRNEIRGYDAIWNFVLPELEYILEGKILARNGSPAPDARINIVGSDGESARINAKGDGSYRFKLKKGVNYQLQASANEFLNQRDSISTFKVNTRESQKFIKNFNLIPTFQFVKIDNIYYDFDKATLRPESQEGLNALIAMMNENPNITIEMSANTDYKGNDEYNRDLSARRAKAVIDYMIKAGVDAARLTAIGYGEVKPFVVDVITNQMYNFLPQGTELTEEYILTLPPEQQEIANQINRRTEFIIKSTTYNMY
ncbi:MAG: PorE family type IX secretion system protein [Paludibacteraceae bacterium]